MHNSTATFGADPLRMADLDLDVGVDLDGCLYDFVGALRSWTHLSTGRPIETMPAAETWNFYKDQWEMTTAEFLALYESGVRANYIFTRGSADRSGVAALQHLTNSGHRLHIVTARDIAGLIDLTTAATAAWLEREGVPYTSLTVVSGPKAPTVLDRAIDVAIDDAAHHYDELIDTGCVPVLLSRPWNDDHPGRRVACWDGFTSFVDSVAAGG